MSSVIAIADVEEPKDPVLFPPNVRESESPTYDETLVKNFAEATE